MQAIFWFLLFSTLFLNTLASPFSRANRTSLRVNYCSHHNCNQNKEKYIGCYFTNWAWYRSAPAKYRPENIDASLCTHIFYAFSVLNPSSLLMVPSDPWADIDNKFYKLVTQFKAKGLKVLLSIGGWNNSGTQWSALFGNPSFRARFIKAALIFLRKYNFDGLDIDYEYPGCPQGQVTPTTATDKENFNVFVSELKQVFNKKLLLTVTAGGGEYIINNCYNMAELCQLADWINVMAYDYNSPSAPRTGANAPTRGTGSSWGVYETMNYYQKDLKCPTDKLVLGLPFYGHTFELQDSSNPNFGVPSVGPGPPGPYTKSTGTLAYYEICLNLKNGWKSMSNQINDSYAWSGRHFVSYDGEVDIQRKSCLINQNNWKGAMIWSLDFDDFSNICGKGSYPLLKALNQNLQ